jgi:multiple sugar transport system permease protein
MSVAPPGAQDTVAVAVPAGEHQTKQAHPPRRARRRAAVSPAATGVSTWFRYALLGPLLILVLVVVVLPFLGAVVLSFTDTTLISISRDGWSGLEFTGFQQFMDALTDPAFHHSLLVTAIFATGSLLLEFGVGISLALLVNRQMRVGKMLTTIFIVPILMPPVAIGLIWKFMLDDSLGILNYTLSLVGLGPVSWLSSDLALPTLIMVHAWMATPFVFLVMLAGIRSLPVEPMEAAMIDGANAWQRFRRITLPLLRPVIAVVLVIRAIDAIKSFDVIFTLTGGGPGTQTEAVELYVYRAAFNSMELGYGSALSVLLVAALVVPALLFLRSYGRVEEN